MEGPRQITLEQFHADIKAQNAASKEDITFVCPMCGTHQSARDLIEAGAGKTFDEVEKYLAFSCVGRFTNAGSPRNKPDGKPCNWTLGGMFRLHKLEVIADGQAHPRFELAERPKIARAA
ncbi:VVA0879 family protein [Sphingobium sp. WCS2017Hpa-17]|uniref:VVA0879 family protein n=1 Tax=Sphingobium sp. WCS2017Hpa-17 TaxID=3073638 RepID=UPI00288B18B4|nr:VVA0879 family protein [Sphingobium sp. WCS2017Hpa-17]